MKTKSILTLAAIVGFTFSAYAQEKESTVKSADEITKQIRVEGRVAFAQKSLPFKLDSTELATEEALKQLVEIARALQSDELKAARFVITGHTCDLGSDKHNLDLSKRRADAIKKLLLRAGVTEDRLVTDGVGEASPAVPNSSEENRAQNRRVELKLVKAK